MNEKDAHHGVRLITIDSSADGQRLDNFLIKFLKGVPKSRIYRVVRKGEVRVNRGRAKPDSRLSQGDLVRIPPLRVAQRSGIAINKASYAWLLQRILFEDEALIILDKPSGFSVHGGSRIAHGLVEILRQLREATPYLELVHRLDKETSGCLILAKNRRVLTLLHEQLRGRQSAHGKNNEVKKYYMALVKGRWNDGPRDVDIAIKRQNDSSAGHCVIVGEGRQSHSRFEPCQIYRDTSLMRIRLFTGRMHQARAHAAYLGFPIAGDDRYGDIKFNREMRKRGLRRLFLHAERLCFRHPLNGKTIDVSALLPRELSDLLIALT